MVVAKASAELTYPSHVPALAASTTSASGCVLALFSSSCDGPDALPLLQAPPEYGEEVGNIEGESVLVLVVLPLSRLVLTLAPSLAGEMVAWCTKEVYGTRIIPEGALQGVGFIDQAKINMLPEDYGGEMVRRPLARSRGGAPLLGPFLTLSSPAAGPARCRPARQPAWW